MCCSASVLIHSSIYLIRFWLPATKWIWMTHIMIDSCNAVHAQGTKAVAWTVFFMITTIFSTTNCKTKLTLIHNRKKKPLLSSVWWPICACAIWYMSRQCLFIGYTNWIASANQHQNSTNLIWYNTQLIAIAANFMFFFCIFSSKYSRGIWTNPWAIYFFLLLLSMIFGLSSFCCKNFSNIPKCSGCVYCRFISSHQLSSGLTCKSTNEPMIRTYCDDKFCVLSQFTF